MRVNITTKAGGSMFPVSITLETEKRSVQLEWDQSDYTLDETSSLEGRGVYEYDPDTDQIQYANGKAGEYRQMMSRQARAIVCYDGEIDEYHSVEEFLGYLKKAEVMVTFSDETDIFDVPKEKLFVSGTIGNL